jgi:hypothetical protein
MISNIDGDSNMLNKQPKGNGAPTYGEGERLKVRL